VSNYHKEGQPKRKIIIEISDNQREKIIERERERNSS